jgi:hypothetical protein
MKKNKLFIFLSIIIIILVFGVAVSCNLCGAPVTIGETDETEEKTKGDTEGKQDTTANQATDDEQQQAEQPSEESQETTDEVPDEANAQDDSQEGEAPDDNGGQEQSVEGNENEDGEAPQEQVEIRITDTALVAEYSGSVPQSVKDGSYDTTDMQRLIIGEYDTKDWTSQAFLTFSHSQLRNENALITDATLFIDFVAFNGNTSRFNNISIGTLGWGDGAPNSYASEQSVNRIIDTYPSSLHDDISCSSVALQEEIQRFVDNNRLLQFKIYFTGGPLNNNDGSLEYIEYGKAGTNLVIHYIAQ